MAAERRFPPPADDAARAEWLALTRTEGVGPRAWAAFARRFDTPADVLAALPELKRPGGVYLPPTDAALEAELAAAEAAGARMLCLGEPSYPPLLAEIPDPPPMLWALGDPSLAARPCVAVVGARNASAGAQRLAEMLARDLGAAGWSVVSGLARGVDAGAHAGSLRTGAVAAHAGGVDVVYPPQNAALAAALAETGLRLAESPMGESPTGRHFPRRNRVVSGLSRGVVLIEAAERSGSLITARLAAEQGREVMAVPGSPLEPRAAGCNALIREGAALIRDAADVLEALSAPTLAPPTLARPRRRAAEAAPPPAAPDGDAAAQVLALLGDAPLHVDALARAAGLDAAALAATLLDLELEGLLDRRPGDMVARR